MAQPVITNQPRSVALRVGETLDLTITATGEGLIFNWLRGDKATLANNGAGLRINNVSLSDAGIYQCIVRGTGGEARSERVRVVVSPAQDPGELQLDPDGVMTFERNTASYHAIAPLSDGGYVVAGEFIRINGHDTLTLAKFSEDGSIDTTFTCKVELNGEVRDLVELADGRILVVGHLAAKMVTGVRQGWFCVNANGSVATDFDGTALEGRRPLNIETDPTGRIYVIAELTSDSTYPQFIRLSPNGVWDEDFSVDTAWTAKPQRMAISGTGRLYLMYEDRGENDLYELNEQGDIIRNLGGGHYNQTLFMGVDAAERLYVVGYTDSQQFLRRRYTTAGEIDTGYAVQGVDDYTLAAALRPDGTLWLAFASQLMRVPVAGGQAETIRNVGASESAALSFDGGGRPIYAYNRSNLFYQNSFVERVESNMTQTTTLVTSVADFGEVAGIEPLSDGRLMVLGDFHRVAGQDRSHAAIIFENGGLAPDPLTNAFNAPVRQSQGYVQGGFVVQGYFNRAFDQNRGGLARMWHDGTIGPGFAENMDLFGLWGTYAEPRHLTLLSDNSMLMTASLREQNETNVLTHLYRFSEIGVLDTTFKDQVTAWSPLAVVWGIVELLDERIVIAPTPPVQPHNSLLEWINRDGSRVSGPRAHHFGLGGVARLATDLEDNIWVFGVNGIARYDKDGGSSANLPATVRHVGYVRGPAEFVEVYPQVDGDMLLFGNYGFVNDVEGAEPRQYALRFDSADGSVDEDFVIHGLWRGVDAVLPSDQGQFLISSGGRLYRTERARAPAVIIEGPDINNRETTVAENERLQLSAAVFGYADSFQWFRNGERIAGANSAVYAMPATTADDSGVYTLVARNTHGSFVSAEYTVRVLGEDTQASAFHVAPEPVGQSGTTLSYTVNNRIDFAGTPMDLTWSMLLPEGWAVEPATGSGATAVPASATTALAEWSWTNPSASPIEFAYELIPPAEDQGRWEFAGMLSATHGGEAAETTVKPDPLVLHVRSDAIHMADLDSDRRISLAELLRVIEIYNARHGTNRTGRYRLSDRSVDSFAPDPDQTGDAPMMITRHHTVDTDQDGKVALSELLRLIELYNVRSGTTRTGAYRQGTGTPDGFEPDS